MVDWIFDVFGDEFEQLMFDFGIDEQGLVVVILVCVFLFEQEWWDWVCGWCWFFDGVDVLYVYGWLDYFFQKWFVWFWMLCGVWFFVFDLCKYGCSLCEGQMFGYIVDLVIYDQDIGVVFEVMGCGLGGNEFVCGFVFFGYFMGGFILSLWVLWYLGVVDVVVLNSFWLEFQFVLVCVVLVFVVEFQVRIWLMEVVLQVDFGYYMCVQQEVVDFDDLMEIDMVWWFVQMMVVYVGWLYVIFIGYKIVVVGLFILVLVCVLFLV